jgi:hypothetical protein
MTIFVLAPEPVLGDSLDDVLAAVPQEVSASAAERPAAALAKSRDFITFPLEDAVVDVAHTTVA